MDNRDVFTVNDLESKGAYVVVPLGESFRDTWYYLPALAKDTRYCIHELTQIFGFWHLIDPAFR